MANEEPIITLRYMLRAAEVLLSLSVNCAENGLLDSGVGRSDMSAVASETIDPVFPNLGVGVDIKADAAERERN